MKTMQAAVFHGVGDIRLEEQPIPACPADGVLIRVRACGICGSDIRNYHNGLRDGIQQQIMGHEIAGDIVETGPLVTRFHVGDRVALAPDVSCGVCWYCRRGYVNLCEHHRMLGTHFPGGYAQYLALPGEVLLHGFIEPIPAGMPYAHAAFAETAAAVIACQKRLDISMGDRVLIIGDGPVGCLHIETARARGAGLVMLAGLDRLALAEAFHPDKLLDNRDPQAVEKQVLEATDGIGADCVICAVPTVAPQRQALSLCRKRGTVVIYGGVPKDRADTTLDSNRIHYGEITVTGAFSYSRTGLADALEAIRAGQIHPDRYIAAQLPLSRVTQGMNLAEQGGALKVMLDPWYDEATPIA